MSETREVYNVAMQPGRELDELVARVMGWTDLRKAHGYPLMGYPPGEAKMGIDAELCVVPRYSTHDSDAIQALEWLKENNPWENYGPMVLHRLKLPTFVFWTSDGNTRAYYPLYIALAVVEAGKVLGVIECL